MTVVRSPFRWPLVVALCLAMLLPALAPFASAQPLCLGDTVWDAEADACVDADGTPVAEEPPIEEPDAQPTVGPTATDNDGAAELTAVSETFSLTIYHLYCDSSRDWRAYIAENPSMFQACQTRQIDQTINGYASYNGQHWGSFTMQPTGSSGGMYYAGLQNMPRGVWGITADTPAGYAIDPVPICYMRHSNGAGSSEPRHLTPDPATGAFALPANAEYDSMICYVHYILTDRGATVDIVLYVCPADIENFHFRSTDSRRLACNEPMPEIFSFVLTEFRGGTQEARLSGNGNVASFPAVLNGFVRISGTALAGYEPAVVYCETRQPDGTKLKLYRYEAPDAPNTINYEILSRTGKMYCDWFLLPQGSGGTDPLALAPDAAASPSTGDELTGDAPAGTSTGLSVQFWACPKLSVSDDYVQYLASCSADPDPGAVALTADGANVPFAIDDGLLTAQLPATGTVAITADGEPLTVYCSQVLVEDGETVEQFPEVVDTASATLTLGLASGTTVVYCDWFATD